MSATSYTPIVKPEVVFIDELFEEITAGKLRIPRFQRPFVWKPEDMLDLFDSIYKGYPIGSLLLWESTEKIDSLETVGPLPIPNKEGSSRLSTYILDGQQRLATLYGGLRIPDDHPLTVNLKEWRWWIWFDLNAKNFTHVKNGNPDPWLFPIRALSRTVDFLGQARKLEKQYPKESATFIDAAEHLAQKIKNYKIAVIRIKEGSLDQSVEIFSRLNTLGQRMTPDQMVSALTYHKISSKKSLAEYIDEILADLANYHFGNLSRMIVFRAIMAAADKEIHRSEWEDIAKDLKADKLSQAFQDAKTALQRAARFLYEELNVRGDKWLPYANQILLLSQFFHHRETPTKQQRQILTQWFWVYSWSGWLTSVNTTQLNKALKEMRDLAENETTKLQVMPLEQIIRPFPDRYDTRSSRVRALLIFMFSLKPLEPETGEPIEVEKIVSEDENQGIAPVFPRIKNPLLSNPANRILLNRIAKKSIKDRLSSIQKNSQAAVLQSHGIPDEAYQALKRNGAKGFINTRMKHIIQLEREFMQQLGITPPPENSEETDIDI